MIFIISDRQSSIDNRQSTIASPRLLNSIRISLQPTINQFQVLLFNLLLCEGNYWLKLKIYLLLYLCKYVFILMAWILKTFFENI